MFTDLSFSIEPGDRLGLIAANGRGKSSLLRCLAGTLAPISGEVTRTRGLKSALVDQDVPTSLLALTFREATLAVLPPDQAAYESRRAEIVLDDLSIPKALRDTSPSALSGGWQRTALLARAAITEPDLYLLDEPTNHLDIEDQEALEQELLTQGATCLLVSHDRNFIHAVGSRFWQVEKRKLIEVDNPEPFFATEINR